MNNYDDYDFFDEFEEEHVGLVRLSRVRYRLAEGQPDTMGWKVADIEGIELGKVSDLLADLSSGQIMFIAVSIDNSPKTALVPVEGLYLNETGNYLIIPARETEIKNCPDFNEEVVDVTPYVEYWLGIALIHRQI